MGTFHLTARLVVDQLSGPTLPPAHIAAWLASDQQQLDVELNRITFTMCPTHPDPDECCCPPGPGDAWYRARIDSATPDVATCAHCGKNGATVSTCCSSHRKSLCHGCYRRSHFVEICSPNCDLCAAEGLDPFTSRAT